MIRRSDSIKELGYSSENSESLLKLCRDRKYLGWETMKGWNDKSKHDIKVSTSLINDLFDRISKLIQKSNNRIKTVTQFLGKMAIILSSEVHLKDHLSLFSLDNSEDVSPLEKIKRSGQRENEPILYAMTEFNREYGIFTEKLEDLGGRIKTDIVEQILEKSVLSAKNGLDKMMTVFPSLKKTLLKKNNRMVDKIKKLNRTFQDSKLPKERSKKSKFNCFDAANEFVISVKEVDQTMEKLGNLLVEIWTQCILLEEKRIDAIRQAFVKFLDILVEVYGSEAQRTFKNR